MRSLLWLGLLCLGFTSATTLVAQEAKLDNKRASLKDRFEMADRLQSRVSINDIEAPLSEILEFLSKQYDLNLTVDPDFEEGGMAARESNRNLVAILAEPNVLKTVVSLKRMKNVRLETVLKSIGSQIKASHLIYDDRILFVATDAVNPGLGKIQRLVRQHENDEPSSKPIVYPLVTMKVENKLLVDAIDNLADRTETTILIAPQVMESVRKNVSFKLTNTSLDSAVALVAELAELKAVRKGNSYLITTFERALLLDPPPPENAFMGGIQGVGMMANPNKQISEFSAKIDLMLKRLEAIEKQTLPEKPAK